ncbi:aminotransferase DegT, partial [Candidatus Woesearchaeota archaeon]|nr:aminotransferase DegT [Candidatus Woesearchaeota archaeon]
MPDAVLQAQQAVSKLVPNTRAVLTSSGRTAISTALAAAGIGEGHEVIVQAFTCVAVPGSVKWTGARPVFVDIDPATFNMDPAAVVAAITPLTKAIIV